MISRDQLREIGRRTGLHLYQQEKDYLLKLFLYNYFRRFDNAVFKGGTCIKYLYNTQRFSEDLDFNISISPSEFGQQVERTLKEIKLLGIDNGFMKEELFSESYTCDIWFHGPLYGGTEQTRNRFRIDAGKRGGIMRDPQWRLLYSEYSETKERFLVQIMDEEEMLVEKVITLLERKKGRDLYDVWFLLSSEIKLNVELFYKKRGMGIEGETIISKAEYERDMEKLTPVLIPYAQIRKEVDAMIRPLRGL
ncbi:MAG: nucleotidyl transferase AbiEii/AbiGii toxin family protein [Thermoplasmata archaeon]|nr:nucleotidyl transferase AbiEii/AbiGii toxin family protein [Thermoplasmata archaeon]